MAANVDLAFIQYLDQLTASQSLELLNDIVWCNLFQVQRRDQVRIHVLWPDGFRFGVLNLLGEEIAWIQLGP